MLGEFGQIVSFHDNRAVIWGVTGRSIEKLLSTQSDGDQDKLRGTGKQVNAALVAVRERHMLWDGVLERLKQRR